MNAVAAVLPIAVGEVHDHVSVRASARDRFVALLEARANEGLKTYGIALTTWRAKPARADAREELADAWMYLTQEVMERRAVGDEERVLALISVRALVLIAFEMLEEIRP